jgi:hypothetical protein
MERAMTAHLDSAMMVLTSRLATSRGGRVTLHLACILAGSDRAMHWQGITRDLRANHRRTAAPKAVAAPSITSPEPLMHAELHRFLSRFIGTVALALIPVIFTAFVSMPLSLNRHPGEPAEAGLAPQHMT